MDVPPNRLFDLFRLRPDYEGTPRTGRAGCQPVRSHEESVREMSPLPRVRSKLGGGLSMAKATTLILDELIAIADEGYSDGLVLAYHEEPDGEHGDTLAKFVAVDLADTFTEGQPRA